MKKLILSLLFMFYISCTYALTVGNSFKGEIISYLPNEGQIVKKGEPLVKWDTEDIDLEIESLKYTIKEADECVKDSKTDIERAKSLAFGVNHTISTSEYEDVLHENKTCILNMKKAELNLEYYKKLREYYTCPAPYDVKVVKRIVSVGSGLKLGNPILEVEKL